MSTESPEPNAGSLFDSLIIEDVEDFTPEQTTPNSKASRTRIRDRIKSEPVKSSSNRRNAVPPKRKDEFVQPLTEMYTMLGVAITPFDNHCGPIVIGQAEPC